MCSGSSHSSGLEISSCAAHHGLMGHSRSFVRFRRQAATLAAITLPIGMLIGLAGLEPAQAAPDTPTLAQAFDNVGITTAADATAGNYDGIGDSFSASGLAADALTPGRSLLHDGLHDHLAGRSPRPAGQRRRRRPDRRGQRDRHHARRRRRVRVRQHERDLHRDLRGRQHQHRHGHARRLDRHQPGVRDRHAGHDRGLEPWRHDPGQPVLRGDPADLRPASRVGHAAHGRRERRQERLVDAHLQPDDRLARARSRRRARRRLLLRRGPQGLRRHRRQPLVEGLVHGRGRRRCPTSTPRRSTTPTSRASTRSSPGPASPRCSRAT